MINLQEVGFFLILERKITMYYEGWARTICIIKRAIGRASIIKMEAINETSNIYIPIPSAIGNAS